KDFPGLGREARPAGLRRADAAVERARARLPLGRILRALSRERAGRARAPHSREAQPGDRLRVRITGCRKRKFSKSFKAVVLFQPAFVDAIRSRFIYSHGYGAGLESARRFTRYYGGSPGDTNTRHFFFRRFCNANQDNTLFRFDWRMDK